jgi:hypothetical protein
MNILPAGLALHKSVTTLYAHRSVSASAEQMRCCYKSLGPFISGPVPQPHGQRTTLACGPTTTTTALPPYS